MAAVIGLKYEEMLGNLSVQRCVLPHKGFIKYTVLKLIGHHIHNLELLASTVIDRKVCRCMEEIGVCFFVFKGTY